MFGGLRLPLIAIAGMAVTLLAPAGAGASTYTNPAAIGIPDFGAGSPYPSAIAVSGLPGTVVRARATLSGLTHTYPSDVDVLLVSPGGGHTVLMSQRCGNDGGGPEAASGQTFTFDDAAGPFLPEGAFCPSGTYKPTLTASSPFPAPAPAGPYVAAMSALNGSPANGAWQLFVNDDSGGDFGSLAGGWSLDLLTDAKCSGKRATLTGTAGPDVLRGTPGADVILGFGGKDKIKGLAGKDVICGGAGKDKLSGGKGKDELLGQGGKDSLNGGGGKDTCKGGKAADKPASCEVERSI